MPSSMLRTNVAVVTGVIDGCCVTTLTYQWQADIQTLTDSGTWYSIKAGMRGEHDVIRKILY